MACHICGNIESFTCMECHRHGCNGHYKLWEGRAWCTECYEEEQTIREAEKEAKEAERLAHEAEIRLREETQRIHQAEYNEQARQKQKKAEEERQKAEEERQKQEKVRNEQIRCARCGRNRNQVSIRSCRNHWHCHNYICKNCTLVGRGVHSQGLIRILGIVIKADEKPDGIREYNFFCSNDCINNYVNGYARFIPESIPYSELEKKWEDWIYEPPRIPQR